jgi:hypothetical protein
MRTYTRIIFGLNAFYAIVMGIVCLLAPMTAVALHGGNDTDLCSTLLLITYRLIGVNLIPAGVISAVVAADPDKRPILRTLVGMVATLQLICWGIVIGMHDLSVGHIASMVLDMVVQVGLLIAVVGYYPRSVVQQVVVRRRSSLAA